MADATRPAPDEVSESQHPALTEFLIGHDQAEQTLLAASQSAKLHHAWMITGPAGIGKATLAYRFAKFLLRDEASDSGLFGDGPSELAVPADDPNASQIAAQSHLNLRIIRRAWNKDRNRYFGVIRIDDVRALTPFFGQTVGGNGRRVVIVDCADDMNTNAQNAILKSLEEPPANTILLLICNAPGAMLPTIRSRCRRLPLSPLTRDQAAEVLRLQAPEIPAGDFDDLLTIADGSPGQAMRLEAAGGLVLYREVRDLMSALPGTPFDAISKLAQKTEKAGDGEILFAIVMDLIEGEIRRALTRAVVPDGADGFRISPDALDPWLEVCDKIARLRDRAAAVNLNRKAVIQAVFSEMQSAARARKAG